jgi:hypothetical protein
LISTRGTTKLFIEGYGMAKTQDESKTKVAFEHYPDMKMLKSGGGNAEKVYKVHSENLIEVGTFAQSEIDGVGFDPFIVSIMNPN